MHGIISRQSASNFIGVCQMATDYNVTESAHRVSTQAEIAGDTARGAEYDKANLGDCLFTEAKDAYAVDGAYTAAQLLVAVARNLDCTFSAQCGDGMKLTTSGKKPKEMTEAHKARVDAFRPFASYINQAIELDLALTDYESMTKLRKAIKEAQPDDEMDGLRVTLKEAQKVIAENWKACSTERREMIREAIREAARISIATIDDII